jgi:hypothetical protein
MGDDTLANVPHDFYEYDPVLNSWSQKSDFPGTAFQIGCGFVLLNRAFLINDNNEVWLYNPDLDSWSQKNNFSGSPRWNASTFSINEIGYVCVGDTLVVSNGVVQTSTVWQYTSDSLDAIEEVDYFRNFRVIYIPAENIVSIHSDYKTPLTIYNEVGKLITRVEALPGEMKIDVGKWAPGVHFVSAEMKQQFVTRKFIKY